MTYFQTPYTDATAPAVTADAFSGMPDTVEELTLSNGFLRETVLKKLNLLPHKTLRVLNLDNNGIRSFDPADLGSLTIKSLSLARNQIQQLLIPGATFATGGNWDRLEELNLDDNQITSVAGLTGLAGLKTFSMQNNGLVKVFLGAFDNFPALTHLLMRDNKLDEIHHFFDKTGDQIQLSRTSSLNP